MIRLVVAIAIVAAITAASLYAGRLAIHAYQAAQQAHAVALRSAA